MNYLFQLLCYFKKFRLQLSITVLKVYRDRIFWLQLKLKLKSSKQDKHRYKHTFTSGIIFKKMLKIYVALKHSIKSL